MQTGIRCQCTDKETNRCVSQQTLHTGCSIARLSLFISLHLSPYVSISLSWLVHSAHTHTHAVCLYCWIAADEFIYEKEQTLCAIDWQDACNKCSLHVWMHTHHRVLWSSLFVFIAIVHSPLSSSAASSSSSLSSPTSSSYYYCLHPTEFVESRHRTDRSESFRHFAPSFFM